LTDWKIEFTKSAHKNLKKLDKSTKRRITDELQLLATESPTCDVKKLKTRKDTWRLRVGNHRVIFQRDKGRLVIVVIEVVRRGKNTY
jgi:mRNA interferase RelE/StbE